MFDAALGRPPKANCALCPQCEIDRQNSRLFKSESGTKELLNVR
jgi:hypothetical protein